MFGVDFIAVGSPNLGTVSHRYQNGPLQPTASHYGSRDWNSLRAPDRKHCQSEWAYCLGICGPALRNAAGPTLLDCCDRDMAFVSAFESSAARNFKIREIAD